jgi:hypothetical protein
MSHLDEGQLHELLDGELDETARTAALAHLATCERCRAAYEEARSFLAEADSLVDAVQLPATPVVVAAAAPAATPGPVTEVRHIASASRLRRYRTLAWAASVMLAVGLGWYGNSLSRTERPAALQETMSSAKGATGAVAPQAPAPTAEVAQADRATPRPRNAAPAAAPAEAPGPASVTALSADKRLADADEEKASGEAGVGADAALSAAASNQAAPAQAQPAPAPPAFAPVAAEARRKESDRIEVRGKQVAEPVGALAARRAGMSKVDMEEAVRILGGSIRLIDGLTPTRILSGAEGVGSMSLVRVVYEDPPGRELWLDQVRMLTASYAEGATSLLLGDTTAVAGQGGRQSLRWMDQSGFSLSLTGFLPADSLRQLMRRVQ